MLPNANHRYQEALYVRKWTEENATSSGKLGYVIQHTFYVMYHLRYITKQCSKYNMLYTMLMRRLYNNKTSYIYNLQLINTFEYNMLYKKKKTSNKFSVWLLLQFFHTG